MCQSCRQSNPSSLYVLNHPEVRQYFLKVSKYASNEYEKIASRNVTLMSVGLSQVFRFSLLPCDIQEFEKCLSYKYDALQPPLTRENARKCQALPFGHKLQGVQEEERFKCHCDFHCVTWCMDVG